MPHANYLCTLTSTSHTGYFMKRFREVFSEWNNLWWISVNSANCKAKLSYHHASYAVWICPYTYEKIWLETCFLWWELIIPWYRPRPNCGSIFRMLWWQLYSLHPSVKGPKRVQNDNRLCASHLPSNCTFMPLYTEVCFETTRPNLKFDCNLVWIRRNCKVWLSTN